ncbi:MAG: hypothetical protein PHQ14_09845 [Chromatiales bacterium]|jgi:hypothetical protein|nr:hypothetical protein [Chromatiales bacterium]MDX9766994.1 hypothetical protein [Ectothiorhodospiraceae bacterium]
MKQTLFQEKYPIYTLEVGKNETTCKSVDDVIAHFKQRIDAHEAAVFIAVFDHYAHTRSLPSGQIADDILDAKNIVFCFGIALPNPGVMAVRPRSIGVTELADRFVINFMEAPMPVANKAMEEWAKAVKNH